MDETLLLAITGGFAVERDFRGLDPVAVRDEKRTLGMGGGGWRSGPESTLRTVRRDEDGILRATYVANAQIVDRMGDLIISKPTKDSAGWDTSHFFAAGSPFFWNHMSWQPGIGQIEEAKVQRVRTHDGQRAWALVESVRFVTDAAIPYSEAAAILVEAGVHRAVSIGFLGLDVDVVSDEKERERLGLGRWGVVFRSQDQTELSLAGVPANPWSVVADGEGAKKALGRYRREAEKAFEAAVQESRIEASLVREFRQAYPLDEPEAQERLRASLRSIVDMGRSLEGADVDFGDFDADAAAEVGAEIELGRQQPMQVERAEQVERAAEGSGRTLADCAARGAPPPAAGVRGSEERADLVQVNEHVLPGEVRHVWVGPEDGTPCDLRACTVEDLREIAEGRAAIIPAERVATLERLEAAGVDLEALEERSQRAEEAAGERLSGRARDLIARTFEASSLATETLALLEDELSGLSSDDSPRAATLDGASDPTTLRVLLDLQQAVHDVARQLAETRSGPGAGVPPAPQSVLAESTAASMGEAPAASLDGLEDFTRRLGRALPR